MGIGSCENSVVVEEPPRVPVSNQHLCPEFAVQSVHSASDSRPISGENEVGATLTSESLPTNDSGLNGESVEEENSIDTGECDIGSGEESLKDRRSEGEDGRLEDVRVADSACGVCSKESHNVDDAMEEKSQGLSQENGMLGKDGDGKLNGDCESSQEVTLTVGLAGESFLKENGNVDAACLNDNLDDVCMEKSSMIGEDEDGELNGFCDVSEDVTPMVYLDGNDCLNETRNDINACGMERSLKALHDSRLSSEEEAGIFVEEFKFHLEVESVDKLANGDTNHLVEEFDIPLEDLPMVSVASGDCLEESNTADIDACSVEITECLQETKAPVLDEDMNLLANSSVATEVTPVNSLEIAECLDERNGDTDTFSGDKPVEFLLQSPADNEGDDGYPTGDHILPPEVVPVAVLTASGGISEEIHNDTEGYSLEIAGDCLQDSKLQGEDVARLLMGDYDLPLEAIAMDAVADGDCSNEVQTGIDTFDIKGGNKCSQDRRLDDNEGLGNLIGDCESLLTIIPTASVAGGDSNESYTSSSSKGGDDLENIKEDRDSQPKAVPGYCAHQDGQKDDKSSGCFPADDVKEEMVNNSDGVPYFYNNLCIQNPSLQDCESLKLVPLDGELCNKDDVVAGFDSAIGRGNVASSVASEADTFKEISPLLQPCEMKLEASHSSEEVSNCVQNTEENAGSGLNEMIMEAAGVERRIDTDSMGEENDVISDVKVEVENPCNERFVLQPCHPLGGSDDGSSKSLNLLHDNSFLDSIKTSSGQADNQRSDDYGMSCLSEAKYFEIVPPSSQRNDWRSESNHKNQTRKATRNSRKTAKASSPLVGIEVVFEPRKKRSVFRPPRSSAWGLLDTVTQLFVHENGFDDVIPASNKRSRKPKVDKKNEKKNKNGATARSRDSKKCPTLTTKLRLKVKIGKGVDKSLENVTAPELVYTSMIQPVISRANGAELCTRSLQVADREESLQSDFVCRDQGGAASFLGASGQDSQPIRKSQINLVKEKSVEDSKDDYFGVSSDVIKASELTENRCRDPGTSPDSEVINMVPDVLIDSRHHDGLHRTLTSPEDSLPPGDLTGNKKGKKEDKSPQAVRKHKDTSLKHHGRRQNCNNGTCAGVDLDATACADASINSISDNDPSLGSKETTTAKKGQKLSRGKSDSGKVKARSKGEIPQRSAGKEKTNKTVEDQVTSTVECQPGAEDHLADDMGKIKISDGIQSKFDQLHGAVNEQYHPISQAWVSCDACRKWRRIPAGLADLINESQCTWTCMENTDKAFPDCSIPQEKSNAEINAELEISDASGEEDAFGNRLSNKGLELVQPRERPDTVTCASIRTNQFLHRNRKTNNIDEIMVCHCKPHPDCRLGCGDNCLNRMLNIECAPGACPCGELCSNQQFQKRKYAKLEKFPCGKKGFGLKLMEDTQKGKFLIEYVGEVLDMQAYEARQKEYARKGHKHFYFMTLNGSEVIDACVKGNKGRFINHSCDPNCRTEKWMVNGEICIGLFAMRDMKKGEEVTFDYNYVRVFGAAAKKCHCMAQQCRGYIGGDPLSGDVIIQSDSEDEYPKPVRRTRCQPGVKDNLVRRADSLSTTVKQIVESAVRNGVERNEVPLTLVQSETKEEEIHHSGSPIYDALDSEEKISPFSVRSELSQQSDDVASELVSTVVPGSFGREETPVKELSKSSSDGVSADTKSNADNLDDRKLSSKARFKVKTSRLPGSKKTPKDENNATDASKIQLTSTNSQALPLKPKKLMEGPLRNRFEAVEEKLNELLDTDGGLSRRKDSAKGYLKLLLLTSASGDSEAIQRNRDLSMILDALLKTGSRAVLTDIINKNGLRMLHKIMKQYRGDFKKIPILRKLLKVLEYLANREILTADHIREDPPRPGMESFRESILSLTEHDDRQVHQIARNFRDKWIPKHLRRNCFSDWDDKSEFSRSLKSSRYSPTRNNGSDYFGRHSSEATRSDHYGRSSEAIRSDHYSRRPSEATGFDHRYPGTRSEATDRVKRSTSLAPSVNPGTEDGVSSSCASVARIRKRKSRWDQRAETTTSLGSFQPKEQKVEHKQIEFSPLNKNHTGSGIQLENPDTAQLTQEDDLEDFPPGFSPPIKHCPAKCPSDIATGHPQEKFISRLPISYGIQLSIVQHFGVPLGEAEATEESWSVAPGVPFLPFPPLPTIPRDKARNRSPTGEVSHSSAGQLPGEASGSMMDCDHHPSTTGDQPAVLLNEGEDGSNPCKRSRESSQDLGTRYFKQQKWNHTKLRPPWHWSKNGSVFVGGDSGGETNGDVTNDVSSASTSTYQQQVNQQAQIDT